MSIKIGSGIFIWNIEEIITWNKIKNEFINS